MYYYPFKNNTTKLLDFSGNFVSSARIHNYFSSFAIRFLLLNKQIYKVKSL